MIVKAWPFLVSRNRYLDYRAVLTPDFICEAKISNLLARVADGDLTEPRNGFVRQITGSKAGDFTIFFRVIKATEKYLNPEGGNEILKDPFGREIYLVEGVVVKGVRSKKDLSVTNQDIEEAHKLSMEGYRQFWEYSEPHPAIPSHNFSLSTDKFSSPLQLEELQPFQVSSKDRNLPSKIKVSLVAFLVTIIVVLILTTWLTSLKNLFGRSIVGEYTTTQVVSIKFNDNDRIDSTINDRLKTWRRDYPKAKVLLSGSLKVRLPDKSKSLDKRKQLTEPTQQTIRLNGDSFQMQDCPLDLALKQLSNQKVVVSTTIQAKIIARIQV